MSPTTGIFFLTTSKNKEFAAKEKLEIVKSRGEAAPNSRGVLVACGGENRSNYFKNTALDTFLKEKEAKHLKYFRSGHIKKEYAVLSKRILENKHQLKKLVDKSIKHVLSLQL